MNEELKNRLETLRKALSADPMGPIIGAIPPGNPGAATRSSHWNAFLNLSDGARFGSVDLFAERNLDANQFRLNELGAKASHHLIVGQVLYQPLLLDTELNELSLLDDSANIIRLGPTDEVITTFFLGRRYVELSPVFAEDEWWDFIQQHL